MKKLRRIHRRPPKKDGLFRRHIMAAGTAAALALGGTGVAGRAIPANDAHQVLVTPDADGDALTDHEESAIGYQPFTPDQNRNTLPDGVELATRCADAISRLPTADVNDPGRIHQEVGPQRGVELCEICGEPINMGTVRVVNPARGLHMELPLISLHSMSEHRTFSYAGELHDGRLDVPALLRLLDLRFPHAPDPHRLPLGYCPAPKPLTRSKTHPNTARPLSLVDGPAAPARLAPDANDLDGDLLADSEELAAGLNLYHADQNENLTPDGIELAQRFAEIIDRLPAFEPNSPDAKGIHKVNFMLRGLEWCEICGESVNMGHWQVVNPTLGLAADVPVISWHYMQHGSFSYLSDIHSPGRMDLAMLKRILEFPKQCGDLGSLRLPGDLSGDCRVDFRDLSMMADQWLRSSEADGAQADRK